MISRRRLLTAAGAAAVVGVGDVVAHHTVLAPSGDRLAARPRATPSVQASTSRTTTLTPEHFGATGDGTTDDQAALQRFFDAGGSGVTLELPADRTYCHSRVVQLTKPKTQLTGSGTLLALDEQASSVWLMADDIVVDGTMTFGVQRTTRRWTAYPQHGLRLGPYTGISVSRITVQGSAAAGIYIGGTSDFAFEGVTSQNTRADGFHMTEGARRGSLRNCTSLRNGDDGLAVVSYTGQHLVTDIVSTGHTVHGGDNGRGVAVVGGARVCHSDVTVVDSSSAALYVAVEDDTQAPSDVTISNARLTGSNTAASVDHGAVLVVGGTSTAPTRITFDRVTIADTRASASRSVGVLQYGKQPSDITFDDFTITGGPSSYYQGDANLSDISWSDWTVDGRAVKEL